MSNTNARHISTNIPSARTTIKSAVSSRSRPIASAYSSESNIEFTDYSLLDTSRKEIIHKEQKARQEWTAKFNPWLIEEYRQMYDNIAQAHGKTRENCIISLKRNEWQQASDVFPPLNKRLAGQRRRRLLGTFPETENDTIGWKVLSQQTVAKYERAKTASIPKHYKLSNWPMESFY